MSFNTANSTDFLLQRIRDWQPSTQLNVASLVKCEYCGRGNRLEKYLNCEGCGAALPIHSPAMLVSSEIAEDVLSYLGTPGMNIPINLPAQHRKADILAQITAGAMYFMPGRSW